MAKISPRDIHPDDRTELFRELREAMLHLKGRDEAHRFLHDLLTPSETVMLGRRLRIAKRLAQGKSHDAIRNELGVGYSTIARVDRWLERGFRGYRQVVPRLLKADKKRAKHLERMYREAEEDSLYELMRHQIRGLHYWPWKAILG